MKESSGKTQLEVVVELKEFAEKQKWPSIAAYVFSRSGHFLTKQSITPDTTKPMIGRIELIIGATQEYLLIKIGPDVGDVGDLQRYNPVVNKVLVIPEKRATLSFQIERLSWQCWQKTLYVITGTVEKREDAHNAPICFGEVDIYDVDIEYCLRRLPDPIVERLRDAIIDIAIDPPPRIEIDANPVWPHWDDDWCGTPPGKPPRPPIHADVIKKLEALPPEWAFAKQRFIALSKARTKMNIVLEKMPQYEKHALLSREAVEGVKISQILYSNTAQFRTLLVDKFTSFRFWLCWYPWIYWLWWPHCGWYSLEHLGTAELQQNGSFSQKVWLSICRKDIPDLWLVVRQKTNGVDRVIYARSPVPCNTYWNHPSGKTVHLVVTDPNAVACYQDLQTDLDPASLWVVPLAIGNYSLKKIYGTGAGSLPADSTKIGLYQSLSTGLDGSLGVFNDGPFGGTLGIRILFSPALEGAEVKYYRIKYQLNGIGNWTPLTNEVVRHYSHYDLVKKSLEFRPYYLGPQTVASLNALFEIPPVDPPTKQVEPDATWYVINAMVDLMNGYFDSSKFPNGYVEFKLELFNTVGKRINPASFENSSIAFKLPANDDVWSTISTADPGTVNSALVKPDPEDSAFQAFVFQLQIDNRQPIAILDEVVVNPSGNKTNTCGMIEYSPESSRFSKDESVTMTYQARHPQKFGMYEFQLSRSQTPLHTETGQVGDMGPTGIYTFTADLKPDPADESKLNLLGSCPEAAFAESLYIWNMAFNGWSRVGPDASAGRAFALVQLRPGSTP